MDFKDAGYKIIFRGGFFGKTIEFTDKNID